MKSPNKIACVLSIAALAFSCATFAADPKTASASKDKKAEDSASMPGADSIRCEKIVSGQLAEFKEALVENCNLNKPFSSSVSRLLNEETYFYCCHKR